MPGRIPTPMPYPGAERGCCEKMRCMNYPWLPLSAFFLSLLDLLGTTTPLMAAGGDMTHRVETEHLKIEWKEGDASADAVEMAQRQGERFYSAIHNLLGRQPDVKLVILLEGTAQRPDGSGGYPHVDSWGRIHLFRFGPTPHSYFSALAHEMVHAFRFHRMPHHDWFFEEGLAEMVARRVDDSLDGFPWYGFSPTLVAGQWIKSGEAIHLAELRANHHALNLRCKAQSYALRGSFFDYLAKTYGVDRVVAMASEPRAGTLGQYTKYLGKSFETLVSEWRSLLEAELESMANAEELARRYRTETPVQYMEICREGASF